jgi:hypothetical protein
MRCSSVTPSIAGQGSDICPADGHHHLLASSHRHLLASMKETVGPPIPGQAIAETVTSVSSCIVKRSVVWFASGEAPITADGLCANEREHSGGISLQDRMIAA